MTPARRAVGFRLRKEGEASRGVPYQRVKADARIQHHSFPTRPTAEKTIATNPRAQFSTACCHSKGSGWPLASLHSSPAAEVPSSDPLWIPLPPNSSYSDPLWAVLGTLYGHVGTAAGDSGRISTPKTVYSSGFRAFRALKSLAIAVATLYGNLRRPFSGIQKWSPRPFVVFRIDPLWAIGATHKGRNRDPLWSVPTTF